MRQLNHLKGRLEHRIIEAVYKHPIIYNPSHPDFKNYRIREDKWSEIVEDFEDVGITGACQFQILKLDLLKCNIHCTVVR